MSIHKISLYANIFFKAAAEKPNLYFLIGPPAVGKSTWIAENAVGAAVCNRDDEVIAAAKETGVGTYDDMFERPPAQLLQDSGLQVPSKDLIQAAESGDETAKASVEEFIAQLPAIAEQYRQTVDPAKLAQFGDIVPFDYDTLKTIILTYGVPPQYVTPFEFENVNKANKLVSQKFDTSRISAVESGQDIVIDMTNLNKSSRDAHRKFIVSAKEGVPPGSAAPEKVNEYYNQIAVVFAESPEGYSDDEKAKIKQIARLRAAEIKAAGGAKTIPDSAYDRMFQSYEPPADDEGFVEIQYVGIPSLNKL